MAADPFSNHDRLHLISRTRRSSQGEMVAFFKPLPQDLYSNCRLLADRWLFYYQYLLPALRLF